MGLRTSDEYLESLNDGREIYYDGERIQDIVGHPVLGQSAKHFARVFALQAEPKFRDLATVEENGERVSRFFTPPHNGEELQQLAKLVEAFAIEAQG